MDKVSSAVEAVLFAAGESVPLKRLSLVLGVEEEEISRTVDALHELYESEGRGMRVLRLDDRVQMCSAPEHAGLISACLEQRKPPMLSQAALETLAVVAYFQPVTRAYVEQVRGVDSSYSVGMLTERGLIEECGRLEAPGRPAVFRTTDVFLRTMGISRLSELPVLPEVSGGEGLEKIQSAIDKLTKPQETDENGVDGTVDAPGGEG
ncbi:MAG: SMC-Scp complex subunit ScpB [Oscillospiraceae bacterium]|nr:SMC-Scp complex subunit ScpB [Oscillospiraceae bacterium]